MTCALIFTFDLRDDVNLSSEVCWCKHFDKYHVCPLCANLFITVSTTTMMINIITTTIQDQIILNVNQTSNLPQRLFSLAGASIAFLPPLVSLKLETLETKIMF